MRFALALASLFLLLAACGRTAPEDALRRDIDAMRAAVEARDAGALADGVAEDFIGPDGMDREAARRLAQVVFLRNRQVDVTLGPLDVAMRGEGGATVRFTAALTGGAGVLPNSGQVYDVRTDWRQDGDEWELVAAEWTPKL